jgi:hypothetical protein
MEVVGCWLCEPFEGILRMCKCSTTSFFSAAACSVVDKKYSNARYSTFFYLRFVYVIMLIVLSTQPICFELLTRK